MKRKRKNGIQRSEEFGIDVSLLYGILLKTTTERLQPTLDMLENIKELRKAGLEYERKKRNN